MLTAAIRAISAAARFAAHHPGLVLAAWLTLATGVAVLAVYGGIWLLTPPLLPKLLFYAAMALAAWLVITRRR
jgi:hypothetical protein